jgi:hypothetical protein
MNRLLVANQRKLMGDVAALKLSAALLREPPHMPGEKKFSMLPIEDKDGFNALEQLLESAEVYRDLVSPAELIPCERSLSMRQQLRWGHKKIVSWLK